MANELQDKPGNAQDDAWRPGEIPGIDSSRTAGDGDLPVGHPDNLEGAYNNSATDKSGLNSQEKSGDESAEDDASKA
jgi:hypothetical protein